MPLFYRNKLLFLLIIILSIKVVPDSQAAVLPLKFDTHNPGKLSASFYTSNKPSNSLLVLLHGCGQNSIQFAKQNGFLEAAKSKNFILLLPQQNKNNNIQLCFNWFNSIDQKGNNGEAASIIGMINYIQSKYAITDVYIVGFSAGGSMASNLISIYPERFRAAAIVGGIGFPCADNLMKAFACMKNGMVLNINEVAEKLMQSQPKTVKWPNLLIITGTEDSIVNPINSIQLGSLWSRILKTQKVETKQLKNISIKIYTNLQNHKYVKLLKVKGMGHGWPVNTSQPLGGHVNKFLPEDSIGATNYIISLWDL